MAVPDLCTSAVAEVAGEGYHPLFTHPAAPLKDHLSWT